MNVKFFFKFIYDAIVSYCQNQIYYWFHYIETYVFADWQFLNFLVVLLLMDGILGFYSSYTTHNFNIKLFSLLFQKVLVYTCFLVLVHIVSHFTIEGEKNSLFGWFNNVAYSAVIVRESIYILEKIGAIRPGLIPGWILKKLKQYDRDGFLQTRPTEKQPEQ